MKHFSSKAVWDKVARSHLSPCVSGLIAQMPWDQDHWLLSQAVMHFSVCFILAGVSVLTAEEQSMAGRSDRMQDSKAPTHHMVQFHAL